MAEKKNIESIVRELKELQSLSDALAVCNPLPQSLLQLIKDKALRVATLADQAMNQPEESCMVTGITDLQEKQADKAVVINNDDKGIVLNNVPDEMSQTTRLSDITPLEPIVSDEESNARRKSGLAQRLTLNERFRFRRNLFSENEALMMSVFAELDDKSGLQEMEEYLKAKFSWDWESAPVLDFLQFLERNTN